MALGGLGTGTLALDHAGRFQEVRLQNNWRVRLLLNAIRWCAGGK